jgi:hypothetical protein
MAANRAGSRKTTAARPHLSAVGSASALALGSVARPSVARARSASRSTRKFLLLVYRMPAAPTAGRVAVWRLLQKVGAIYIQQSCCVFPDTASLSDALAPVLARISASKGEYHLLPLGRLSSDEQVKLVAQFIEQSSRHYAEIIENCEVNFQKEIEFETFRKNFTYEEAEEIRAEYEKICNWFTVVEQRDWFGAPNRREAATWLRRCKELLERFEARVYSKQVRSADETARKSRAKRRQPRRPRLVSTA